MALALSARLMQTIAAKCKVTSCLSQNVLRGISTQKPNKPGNGFFLYMSKIRPELTRNNPEKKLTELTTVASQMYKDLNHVEKEKLKLEADRLAAQYKVAVEQWQNSLTEEEKKELAAIQAKKRAKRRILKMKKISKENNKPKRPLSPFLLFNKEYHRMQAVQGNTDRNLIEVTRKAAELWRSMTDDEKKAYNDTYSKRKEQFDRDLAAWEQDMFAKGQHSVIRKLHLKQLLGPKPRKAAKKRPTKVTKKAGVRAAAINTVKKTGTKAATKSGTKK